MGFFNNLFGPKKFARARHILVDQVDVGKLEVIKKKLNGTPNMVVDFGKEAAKLSKCPSGKRGGDLGEFKQGAMVPAFDKVVFNEALGEIHGPINTPFGSHLILIEEREE